jgi:ubiquinone biosynthesis monooxygenase Coq7
MNLDPFILQFDLALRTALAPAQTSRDLPGKGLPEDEMTPEQKTEAARLMRVNHTGEVCAQALYQGQALTARDKAVQAEMERAAREEGDHLNWCETRIAELGGRKSVLNPFFYGGALTLGALAGALGDKWNLGFLAETERQVVRHLDGHLARLPETDQKSRAVVEQMKEDEARHAQTAVDHGGGELPGPVKTAMQLSARVMTGTSYWL